MKKSKLTKNKKITKNKSKKVVKKRKPQTKKKFAKKTIARKKELDLEVDEVIEDEELEEKLEDEDEELDEDEETEEETEDEVDVIVKKKKPKVDKTKFYVEPKKFDDEIVIYYNTGNLSDDLAEMVNKIAHKLSYAPNFINYTYREDMVGDALIRMFKALMSKKYDREKGTNPFSYFTRIAFNAFRNRIKKEKRTHETHLKYQAELMTMSEHYNSYAKNNKSIALKQHLNED